MTSVPFPFAIYAIWKKRDVILMLSVEFVSVSQPGPVRYRG